MSEKVLINVEIEVVGGHYVEVKSVEDLVDNYFLKKGVLKPGTQIKDPFFGEQPINLIRICEVCGSPNYNKVLDYPSESIIVSYHVYRLNEEWCGESFHEDQDDNKENDSPSFLRWDLPCFQFDELWDVLVFDDDVKDSVLSYIKTSLAFAQHNINQSIVTWNSVVLFHGPPGTGKTTLCKAIAQKLSIRLNKTYHKTMLIEINSHSLFSKWFSESGKLVLKFFNSIKGYLTDPTTFVCLLIDEVETLTHSRTKALNSTEPSDAIRVVNAVLTQIDIIKNYSNALVMATSNVSEAIDVAFADRADLKRFIGYPSVGAIYKIYCSCMEELMRTRLILGNTADLFDLKTLSELEGVETNETKASNLLLKLSKMSSGLSGRTLRKIPFLAYSLLGTNVYLDFVPSLLKFLTAMEETIKRHNSDCCKFKNETESEIELKQQEKEKSSTKIKLSQ